VEEHCRAVLDAARAEVAAADPSLEVTTEAYVGSATMALLDAARHADTVVVGSRGRRALTALLLGATSLEVAAHAACPVVVTREGRQPEPGPASVVVGVDGSAASSDAVGFAFGFASAHRLGLTALHAFQVEYVEGVLPELAAEASTARVAQQEQALTSEAVAGWREKYPDVDVSTRTVPGHPVDALVDASQRASLLVIGGRRRGTIGSFLLGAVGHRVLHDSHCPVAVVRAHPA
jgi:nucleotide-binding universal stress UspA family protein